MKKLLKRYELLVYDNGDIALTPLPLKENADDLKPAHPTITEEEALFDSLPDIPAVIQEENPLPSFPEELLQDLPPIFAHPVQQEKVSSTPPQTCRNSSAPSERIRQVMEVIKTVDNLVQNSLGWTRMDVQRLNRIVSEAYRVVANSNHITLQSVADKAQRQLTLQKQGFVSLLMELFTGGYTADTCLETQFYQHLTTQKKITDIDLLYAESVLKTLLS